MGIMVRPQQTCDYYDFTTNKTKGMVIIVKPWFTFIRGGYIAYTPMQDMNDSFILYC